MDLVRDGQADAFVSAGNTGAAVAAATLKLRTLKGVDRAGISTAIPNEHGLCSILDAGANPEAKPEHLVAYAVMGTAFAAMFWACEQSPFDVKWREDEKAPLSPRKPSSC